MKDCRGEGDDPGAASGLLHTLRAGHLEAPLAALAEPRWGPLRCAAATAQNRRVDETLVCPASVRGS